MPIPRGAEMAQYYHKDHPNCASNQFMDSDLVTCRGKKLHVSIFLILILDCDGACTSRCWGLLSTDCFTGSVTSQDM